MAALDVERHDRYRRCGVAADRFQDLDLGFTPISRICSATRNRCSSFETTIGARAPSEPCTRSTVS